MPTKNAKNSTNPQNSPLKFIKNPNFQTTLIAVLSTIIILMLIFISLIFTGVIKIGDSPKNRTNNSSETDQTRTRQKPSNKSAKTDDDENLIKNPNPRVKINGKLMKAAALEFYLPDDFVAASSNPTGDGVYTYNLEDDDGWATVNVYVEKTSDDPTAYLMSKNSTLEVTDEAYEMNGQTWIQAENGSSLAYATKYGDHVYAIIYVVKIDSDETSEAMSMLPKTLYFPKLYK